MKIPRVALVLLLGICTAFWATPARASDEDITTPAPTSVPGNTLSFQTDLFTGQLTYTIPIQVPPARQHTQPGIVLGYSSSTGNTWCGVGWNLDMGYIQRDTRRGVPRKWSGASPLNQYDDDRGFVFSFQGVNTRLVFIAGNEYRPEIDHGSWLRFAYVNPSWEVTDKNGTKFYFGESSASRMEHPLFPAGQGSAVFRWQLNRIRDSNGNETTLAYTKNGNQLYLSRISYNANVNAPAVPATHTVDFVLETRSDPDISLLTGYRVTTAQRLKEIVVKVGTVSVRRYRLNYTASPSTYRSLLTTVTQVGSDDSTALPSMKFSYQAKPFQFNPAIDWGPLDSQGAAGPDWNALSAAVPATGQYVALADINGDGLPDRVLQKVGGPYDRFKVQLNTGSGFGALIDWAPLDSQGFAGADWNSLGADTPANGQYVAFQDMNGDGLPDRVLQKEPSPYDRFKVQLNTGRGFLSAIDWSPVDGQGAVGHDWTDTAARNDTGGYQYVDLADINGDGLADRVMGKISPPYDRLKVQLNTGSGFGPLVDWAGLSSQGAAGPDWNSIAASVPATGQYVALIDVNGDRLPDRVMSKTGAPYNTFVVQLNNGAGFEPAENWGPLDSQGAAGPDWNGITAFWNGYRYVDFADINGDGLPDRVMGKLGPPYDRFKVQLNTGSGFGPLVDWTPLESQGAAGPDWNATFAFWNGYQYVGLQDINGDGLPDRIMGTLGPPYNRFKVQLNKGPVPDLLATVDNSLGGALSVTYAPSTAYDNTDGVGKSLLPFPVWTVATVTVSDGLGTSSTTRYAYKGGAFDPATREFRGFNRVEVTDPLGAKSITYFHQSGGIDGTAQGEYQDQASRGKKGIPYRIEVWGSDGRKYHQTLNKVDERQLHPSGWTFPFIAQTIQMDYEGLATYRATAKQLAYDPVTLNLITESDLGEVASINETTHAFTDLSTDDVYTRTSYATLANADIKNKPASVVVTADSAGLTKLRETVFPTYEPQRGNLQEVRTWLNTTNTYVSSTMGYDQYGNPTSATNPIGITTTTQYDPTYRIFPVTQTTGTFTTSSTFDVASGQVLTSTDPKGLVAQTSYDVFFRPVQTAISTTPLGPPTLWRQKRSYTLGGIANGISSNVVRQQVFDPLDPINGLETYAYTDGLGRSIQTRMESELPGQFRVSETRYDLRGSPRLTTVPSMSAGSAFTVLTNQPGTTTDYDPIGRAFRVTPPAGDLGSPTGPMVTAFTDGPTLWTTVVTDSEGKVRKSLHDAYGRATQIIEVNGGNSLPTTYTYDKLGGLTKVTDAAGNMTTMSYDSLGRKLSMTDPDMGTWSYSYDAADRLLTQTDAKNQKLKFFYADPIGRLTRKEIYKGDGITLASAVTYVYDTTDDPALPVYKGQLARVVDRQGWQKYGYDLRGRMLAQQRYLYKTSTAYRVDTVYDDADRMTELRYPGSVARIKYSYDTAGHLVRVENLAGTGANEVFYTAQGFNALGQPLGMTYGNGLQTSYTYYANSKRLQRLQTTKPGGGFSQDLAYTFDTLSDIKAITDSVYTGAASSTIGNLQYDDLHRLTSYTRGGVLANFSYNAIGNILVNPEFGTGTYGYGSPKPHAVTSANGKTYQYDAAGNMKNRGSQFLQYDEENQLVNISDGTSTVLFGYADGGARLWRQKGTNLAVWIGGIYEVKDGKTLCHVLAGGKRIATFEPITGVAALVGKVRIFAKAATHTMVASASPSLPRQGPWTVAMAAVLGLLGLILWGRTAIRLARARRSWWRTLLQPGIVLKQCVAGLTSLALFFATTPMANAAPVYSPVFYYYHDDHLGSSNLLTDRTGNMVQHYEYLAYGKERFKDNALAFSVSNRYTDQILDEDTGLYYYGARYYDPELGRFTQPDSIVPSADDPQSLNRYTYTRNNPLKFVDPTGHYYESFADLSLSSGSGYDNGSYGGSLWDNNFDSSHLNLSPSFTTSDSFSGHGLGSSASSNNNPSFLQYWWQDWSTNADQDLGRWAQGLWGGARGLFSTVIHPINTLQGLGTALGDTSWQLQDDPYDFINGLGKSFARSWSDPNQLSKNLGGLSFNAISGAGALKGAQWLGAVKAVKSGVQANRAKGLAAETLAIQDLIAEGNTSLGSHVGARTSGGLRVIDHLFQTPSGRILALEVKSGNAVRNRSQLFKDSLMATEGAVITGKNAPAALRGQQLIIETVERSYP